MESKDTDGNEATLPKSSSSGHVLIVEAPEEAGKHEVETKRHRRNLSEDRFSGRVLRVMTASIVNRRCLIQIAVPM